MQRSRRKPFFAAYNVADFHEMVVHNISEVIRRHTITFKQDFIVHVVCVYTHPSTNGVFKANLVVSRKLHSNDVRLTSGYFSRHLVLRKGQRIFHVFASDVVVLPV